MLFLPDKKRNTWNNHYCIYRQDILRILVVHLLTLQIYTLGCKYSLHPHHMYWLDNLRNLTKMSHQIQVNISLLDTTHNCCSTWPQSSLSTCLADSLSIRLPDNLEIPCISRQDTQYMDSLVRMPCRSHTPNRKYTNYNSH